MKIETQTSTPEAQNLHPIDYNLFDLQVMRKHYHRLGNRAKRELAMATNEKAKEKLRKERDHYCSLANYLDVDDIIKMGEL
jgi:hypothetical protein